MDHNEPVNNLLTAVNTVYNERNQVVALAAVFAKLMKIPVGIHIDADQDAEWRNVIMFDLPTGQVSWHIKDTELPLFWFLPTYEREWDGHTSEEKYDRIKELARCFFDRRS